MTKNLGNAEENFVLMLTSHHERMLRFVRTLIPNETDAEDVFQRASVVLWQKHGEYDSDRDFFPWACRFLHFEVLNYRKRIARDRLAFSEDVLQLLADDQIDQQETLQERRSALDTCLEKLTTPQREILRHRYSDHSTLTQLARNLGSNPKRLYKQLQKILLQLNRCVEGAVTEP